MKPKLAVSAILFLMASSLMQTGTAQQSEDLYQGTVTARQETDGNITYNLKENLSFENFQTNDGSLRRQRFLQPNHGSCYGPQYVRHDVWRHGNVHEF